MNYQLLHIINLCCMISNLYFHNWVIWSGTLELIDYFPLDLGLNWGLYSIEVESSTLLNDISLYLSIPNFLEFMNSNFNVELIKPTTIPLYYSVAILYILLFLYKVFNVGEAFVNRNVEYNKIYIQEKYLIYRTVIRLLCSVFIITSLFTSYNTSSLCMNNYIVDYNSTVFDVVSVKATTETCSYGWNFLFILISEGYYVFELMFIYYLSCGSRKRSTSDFSQYTNLDCYVDVDTYSHPKNLIKGSLDDFLTPNKNRPLSIQENIQTDELEFNQVSFIKGQSMRKNSSRNRLQ